MYIHPHANYHQNDESTTNTPVVHQPSLISHHNLHHQESLSSSSIPNAVLHSFQQQFSSAFNITPGTTAPSPSSSTETSTPDPHLIRAAHKPTGPPPAFNPLSFNPFIAAAAAAAAAAAQQQQQHHHQQQHGHQFHIGAKPSTLDLQLALMSQSLPSSTASQQQARQPLPPAKPSNEPTTSQKYQQQYQPKISNSNSFLQSTISSPASKSTSKPAKPSETSEEQKVSQPPTTSSLQAIPAAFRQQPPPMKVNQN